jgi:hypothetical protein
VPARRGTSGDAQVRAQAAARDVAAQLDRLAALDLEIERHVAERRLAEREEWDPAHAGGRLPTRLQVEQRLEQREALRQPRAP